jgi:hypothetical protein
MIMILLKNQNLFINGETISLFLFNKILKWMIGSFHTRNNRSDKTELSRQKENWGSIAGITFYS